MTTEPTGRDLARLALHQARAAAKAAPTRPGPGKSRRRTAAQRGAGRDPVGLGAVMAQLMADEGVALGGGTVLDQWATIAPELVGKVAAERFVPETGVLSLRPVTAAYGTQLRLLQAQMVARINTKLGRTVVRALRVLPPSAVTQHAAPQQDATPAATVEPAPIKTRETASAGYRQALAVSQGRKADRQDRLPPAVRTAVSRQDEALRARREPEGQFADARELIEQLRARAAAAADVEKQALARARAQKAGRTLDVPRVFDQAG